MCNKPQLRLKRLCAVHLEALLEWDINNHHANSPHPSLHVGIQLAWFYHWSLHSVTLPNLNVSDFLSMRIYIRYIIRSFAFYVVFFYAVSSSCLGSPLDGSTPTSLAINHFISPRAFDGVNVASSSNGEWRIFLKESKLLLPVADAVEGVSATRASFSLYFLSESSVIIFLARAILSKSIGFRQRQHRASRA